jgi:phage recombination protein Bet
MPEADRLELIRQALYPQLPPDMFTMFEHICQQQKLSLLTTDLYPRMMFSQDSNTPKLVIITTIRAFRKIADRTGRYRGQTECQWAGSDGVWVDTWNSETPPAWARVGIRRAGFDEPVYGKASWEASAPYNETEAGLVLDPIWQKRGPMQLVKCAEADGFRRAFTDETANLYLHEEMQQAEREQKRLKALAERDPTDQRPVREFLRSSFPTAGRSDPVQDFVDDSPLESEEELFGLLADAGYTTHSAQQRALISFQQRYARLFCGNRPAFYNQVARDLRKEIHQQPVQA